MAFDHSISWFQEKLGKYDKASWERTFEEQEQESGFIHVPKKPGGLKPELIDVDLVIGSTFPKTKPVHTWFAVTQKGLVRVLLFPFFRTWWTQQLSPKLWFLFLLLYLCEILVLVIYLREWESHWKVVTWSEACGPALIMLLLGVLYMYMVSTDYSRSSQRRKVKSINRRRRAARQKRKSSVHENGGAVSQNILMTNGIRQRKSQVHPVGTGLMDDNKDNIETVETVDPENGKDGDNDKTEEEISESGETTSSTTESDVSDVDMDSNNEDPFAWDKQVNGSPGLETSPNPPPTAEKEIRIQQGTTIAPQKQPTSSNSETTAEVEAVLSQGHKTTLLTRTLCAQYYFLLILVSSAPGNAARRKDIRKTWGVDFAIKPRWKTVFLVAQTRIQTEEDSLLATEDAFFGDLVRADYYDHYWNQTLKIQMGFEWAARYCKFSFLLKMDDDVFVNTMPLLSYLGNLPYTSREKFFMGKLYKSPVVFRSGKWRVSFEEYSRSTYPDFCAGFGYVLSADIVALFVHLFDVVPPFRLDDVYVGMLADKAGVNITHNEGFIVVPPQVTKCILQDNTLVWHGVFGNCLLEVFSQTLKEMNHGHADGKLL